jgi:hypothetical protein
MTMTRHEYSGERKVTILNALKQIVPIRRRGWPKGVFISVCNGTLWIHSSPDDLMGRLWNPSLHDITSTDWS